MRQVKVDEDKVIGYGANGRVYKLDDETIIKVYYEGVPLEDIERERRCAQKAFLDDIPTAITFDVVDCDGSYGIIFENFGAETYAGHLASHPEEFESMITRFIELFNKIHSTEVKGDEFIAIKELYGGFLKECRDYYTPEEYGKLEKLLNSFPDRRTIVHGDFHGKNIMISKGELFLIDMGDVSFGHPIFDLMCTGATQINLVRISPEFAEQFNGVSVEFIIKAFRRLVKDFFHLATEEEIDEHVEFVARLAKLKTSLAPAVAKGISPEIIKASIDDVKANLIPYIDEIIESDIFNNLDNI